MKHLKENNETYLSHLRFALTIAATLYFRSIIFLLHGLAPFCNIPKQWNLQKTKDDLGRWNAYTIQRKKKRS